MGNFEQEIADDVSAVVGKINLQQQVRTLRDVWCAVPR